MTALRKPAPDKVTIGLRFRSVLGDTKALWEVREALVQDYYECEVLNEPNIIHGTHFDGDFAGRKQAFHENEILGHLRIDALFGGYDPANYEPQTAEFPQATTTGGTP